MHNELQQKILQWLGNGRVGCSSKAMAFAVAQIEINDKSHPYDPDDLNRCLLLIQAVPEIEDNLDEIAKLSPEWDALMENWHEVKTTFLDEVGLDWCKGRSAPKTYKLMQEIFEGARS